MNTTHIDTTLNAYRNLFSTAETILADLPVDASMPFPLLFTNMTSKLPELNVEEVARMQEPVREYVRSHPYWRIANGHGGGVQHKAFFEARQNKKTQKERTKDKINSQLTQTV